MVHEIMNSVGYASAILFYAIGSLIIMKLMKSKKTRSEQLRDARGKFTVNYYQHNQSYGFKYV